MGGRPVGAGRLSRVKWKVGALVQQYWDFAGDSDRDSVNMMNLQYFYMYSLDETTSRVSKSQGILDRLLNLPNAALVSVESACLAQ
jgi:hypothetical protein